jgi:hypothetical protein
MFLLATALYFETSAMESQASKEEIKVKTMTLPLEIWVDKGKYDSEFVEKKEISFDVSYLQYGDANWLKNREALECELIKKAQTFENTVKMIYFYKETKKIRYFGSILNLKLDTCLEGGVLRIYKEQTQKTQS